MTWQYCISYIKDMHTTCPKHVWHVLLLHLLGTSPCCMTPWTLLRACLTIIKRVRTLNIISYQHAHLHSCCSIHAIAPQDHKSNFVFELWAAMIWVCGSCEGPRSPECVDHVRVKGHTKSCSKQKFTTYLRVWFHLRCILNPRPQNGHSCDFLCLYDCRIRDLYQNCCNLHHPAILGHLMSSTKLEN